MWLSQLAIANNLGQKKNTANDPSIFPHQNYGKAFQSPDRRCVLNRRKSRKEKLAKSGKKTIQNFFSIDLFHPYSVWWIYKYIGKKESNI